MIITIARKPIPSSVTQNILSFWVGGINIDACRVDAGNDVVVDDGRREDLGRGTIHPGYDRLNKTMFRVGKHTIRNGPFNQAGRWPANVILVSGLESKFPITSGFGIKCPPGHSKYYGVSLEESHTKGSGNYFSGDSGSAARFFYQVKE